MRRALQTLHSWVGAGLVQTALTATVPYSQIDPDLPPNLITRFYSSILHTYHSTHNALL